MSVLLIQVAGVGVVMCGRRCIEVIDSSSGLDSLRWRPMCSQRVPTWVANDEGFVRKSTGWLSNARGIGSKLVQLAHRRPIRGTHQHIVLTGGKASSAEEHKPEVTIVSLSGLVKQLASEGTHWRKSPHSIAVGRYVVEQLGMSEPKGRVKTL